MSSDDKYVETLIKQCEDWEKMYNEVVKERDLWKKRYLEIETNPEREDRPEKKKDNDKLRHV